MLRQTLENQDNTKEILRYISKKLDSPLTHRVLQNFPPNGAFQRKIQNFSEWIEAANRQPRSLHLYFSIPFCTYKGVDKNQPEKCGFCLFPTLLFSRKDLSDYLDSLINHEIPMYAEHIGKHTLSHPVDSIFLGGGTPNILNNKQYSLLLKKIKNSFLINKNVEISTEGTPELYSYDKLQIFKELGGTRISIGVQQFNDDLIKLSGRKVTKKRVLKVINYANKLDLSVGIDLIYGWPDQTLKRFLRELEELINTGVPRITVYPLNTSHSNYFSRNFQSRIPKRDEMKTMFFKSRELLISNNFKPITLNDYEKINYRLDVSLRHEIAMRNEHLAYRIGFGFAAASKLLFIDKEYGITYRNFFNRETGLTPYIANLKNNRYPIETYFKYLYEDMLLNYISGALQSFSIDLNDFSKYFPGVNFKEKFAAVLKIMESLGWITLKEDIVELTLDGQFNTDIIQGSFFYERINYLKKFNDNFLMD